MPSDFDWIFERDPYWRQRPKEEAPAIPRSHPPFPGETGVGAAVSIVTRYLAAAGSAR